MVAGLWENHAGEDACGAIAGATKVYLRSVLETVRKPYRDGYLTRPCELNCAVSIEGHGRSMPAALRPTPVHSY